MIRDLLDPIKYFPTQLDGKLILPQITEKKIITGRKYKKKILYAPF